MIVKNIPKDVKFFDWEWSSLLTRHNIKLYCTKESYIQHIGIIGQNNKGLINTFDYGINFLPISIENQKIISEFIDELFLEQQNYILNKEKELGVSIQKLNKLDYSVGHAILSIPRELHRTIRKIRDLWKSK